MTFETAEAFSKLRIKNALMLEDDSVQGIFMDNGIC